MSNMPTSFELKVTVDFTNPGKHVDEALEYATRQREKARAEVYKFTQKAKKSAMMRDCVADCLAKHQAEMEYWQKIVSNLVDQQLSPALRDIQLTAL